MQRNTIVLQKPEGMKIPKQKEITKDEGRNKIICRNLSSCNCTQWSGHHGERVWNLCFLISALTSGVGLPFASQSAKPMDEKAQSDWRDLKLRSDNGQIIPMSWLRRKTKSYEDRLVIVWGSRILISGLRMFPLQWVGFVSPHCRKQHLS